MNTNIILQCCVCKRVRNGNEWVDGSHLEHDESMLISHGYCAECAEHEFNNIAAFIRTSRPICRTVAANAVS